MRIKLRYKLRQYDYKIPALSSNLHCFPHSAKVKTLGSNEKTKVEQSADLSVGMCKMNRLI